ncbi:MAG TPA: hypothetical protein VF881_08370 [Polyangiaceae bacterium]
MVGLPTALLGAVFYLAVASLTTTVGSSSAWAQSAPTPNLQRQVRELEERVRIMELEHEALQRRMHLDAELTRRALDELEQRLIACEKQAVAPAKAEAPPVQSPSIVDPRCRNPYTMAADGIRRIKPGCESAGDACEPPVAIDPRGVRKILPSCVKPEDTGAGCASPFYVDPGGVKRVKPDCI